MSTEITRRSFLKGAAASTITIGAMGIINACSPAESTVVDTAPDSAPATETPPLDYADTISWDSEYDVVVLGYGAAGANAAITAADAGVKVLLAEKCAEGYEGGNSKYSGQGIQCFTDADQAFVYYKSLRGLWDTPSDAVIKAYIDKVKDQREWLIYLGAKAENLDDYNGTGKPWTSKGEFPEWEGAGCMLYYCVSGKSWDGAYYYMLQDNVNARSSNIDVWYSSPATHLIQHTSTKVILGVQLEKEGTLVNVRARNGVVLATGGFENSQEMVQNYLQQPYMTPYGAVQNTGDGIKLAQGVNAKLWHMSNAAGFLWCYKSPISDRGVTVSANNVGIFVGPSGERYMDERQPTRHGRIYFAGRYIQMPSPLPAFMVMDDAVVSSTKVIRSFSENNADEISKGWFLKGDTLEELADVIEATLPKEVLMPNAETTFKENFLATIAKWNASCKAGKDERYDRPADTMVPISKGPFYALELGIMMYNTQGGPQRNENAEVLDLNEQPIPHLYSAGELGAIWSDAYNGGGNLGECTAFGRIAGENAAAAKKD